MVKKNKQKIKKDWPTWAERALQGVAFWIAHRRCVYRRYPLSEGALIAEICSLIHANLPDGFMLTCEMQYADLLPGTARPTALTQRARADLVVSEKSKGKTKKLSHRFVIEVKRASASTAQIDADLGRLAEVQKHHPNIRSFMFVIAEANRPKRFVNGKGMAKKKGEMPIPPSTNFPEPNGSYRVWRVWKAAHAFQYVDHAQYACLLEVFGERVTKR